MYKYPPQIQIANGYDCYILFDNFWNMSVPCHSWRFTTCIKENLVMINFAKQVLQLSFPIWLTWGVCIGINIMWLAHYLRIWAFCLN